MNRFDGWDTELYHHGIRGQKWGIRRYQNEDGSLTEAGIRRYGTVENLVRHKRVSQLTDKELAQRISRMKMEKELRELSGDRAVVDAGKAVALKLIESKMQKRSLASLKEERAYNERQTNREKEIKAEESKVRIAEAEAKVKQAEQLANQAKANAEKEKYVAQTYSTKAKQTETKAAYKGAKIGLRNSSLIRNVVAKALNLDMSGKANYNYKKAGLEAEAKNEAANKQKRYEESQSENKVRKQQREEERRVKQQKAAEKKAEQLKLKQQKEARKWLM